MMHVRSLLPILALLTACAPRTGAGPMTDAPARYLALGDSYTIGEGVAATGRWPVQLAALLRERGVQLDPPEIIARTGWTTDELDAAIDSVGPGGPYDMVSLLIGVNNQYRGRAVDEYRTELRALVQRAIAFAGGRPDRVLVLSIPDWGVTPFAEGRDRARIASELDEYNATKRRVAAELGVRFVDIAPVARARGAEAAMLAPDGLHPSAEMYAEWARLALPDALEVLGAR